jgi:hypothetical protein
MEHAYRLGAASGLLIVVVAVSAAACHPEGCGYYGMTCTDADATGAGGGGGAGAGSGGGGAAGGDTGAPANCDPTGTTTNTADQACGVCVCPNAGSMRDGTRTSPYLTFAEALADIDASIGSKPWRKHIYSYNDAPF